MNRLSLVLLIFLSIESFSEDLVNPKTAVRHADSILMATDLAPFFDALCDNLFDKMPMKSKGDSLNKRIFRRPCRQLNSFKDYDQLLQTTALSCEKQCQNSENKCEGNTCIEACENEKRAGELAKNSYDKSFDVPVTSTPEQILKAYLDVLCDELFSSKIMEKKFYHKEPLSKMTHNGRKNSPSTLSQFKVECEKSKTQNDVAATINKAFNACELNCEGQVASAKKQMAQPVPNKTASPAAQADLSPECVSDACKQRCAGEKRAGILAGEMFHHGLGDSQ